MISLILLYFYAYSLKEHLQIFNSQRTVFNSNTASLPIKLYLNGSSRVLLQCNR